MSETNRIEYKRELNTNVDIEKEVISFLNYQEGGLIYIGIDKQEKVLGVSDIDGDMLKIKDRIKNNISPSAMGLFDVVTENKEGKELIKIIVAGGTEKPYFKKKYGMTEKGCFIRIGTASEPMSQTMIDKLFASRTRHSIGKIRSHRQDLTFEQLKIYYEEKGLTLTNRFKQSLELLTEEGKLNYVAYLLADENGTSIKVAKYSGTDRVDLIENNEYGYCSLIKATKRVIDKLELENKTISKITSKERIDTRLWNAVALREAIINAIIHNDYTREIPPKFEIFSNRFEITNYGGLFEGMLEEDFFDGLSLPRNKELMRVYKDLGMVEQLGSGVPRILQAYSKDCFQFSENYLRMAFPASEKLSMQVTMQVTTQVSTQVKELINIFTGEHTRQYLQDKLNLANRENFRKNYLQSALGEGLIELTIPDKPKSSKQKYRLTEKGILLITK
ncbi:MAG: putative DNA binding domain-containing protein [Bacteroidales bacterium]|nr:putative DNA binding domain-containing protein [Bacteroidales bacterium]